MLNSNLITFLGCKRSFIFLIVLLQSKIFLVECGPATLNLKNINISNDDNSIVSNTIEEGEEEKDNISSVKVDNILFQSNNQEIRTEEENSEQSDNIKEILKALQLPPDFADTPSFISLNLSTLEKLQPSQLAYTTMNEALNTTNQNSSDPLISNANVPTLKFSSPFSETGEDSKKKKTNNRTTRQGGYGTGNGLLDKIMNCPCPSDTLTSVGIKPIPVPFSNYPDPGIYNNPPYGPNPGIPGNKGPGDVLAHDFKSLGGNAGSVIGQIIRIYLMVPVYELSVIKPIVVGLVDSIAQAIEAAGDIVGMTSKSVPGTIRTAAVALKRGLELVGDLIAVLLHILTTLVKSFGAGTTSFAGTVPIIFDTLVEMAQSTGNQITGAIDLLSGIGESAAAGIINAGKTGGNVIGGLVEGNQLFGGGILDGIKYGINGEELPSSYGPAWKK